MIRYRPARAEDADALAACARAAFTETFGTLYGAGDLATFLDEAFGPAGLPAQIGRPGWHIQVALDGDRIAGFAKLGPVAFPGEWSANAIELHQLYVRQPWLGAGIGPALMDWALAHATAHGASEMLLSVFVDNHRAKRFYARYGFQDVGRYDFAVGDTIDEDRIMRLPL
ncbi:GNAT family N-acetyltransferase [Sphingomonas sp. GM_Shp_2]|uniref:GNAT family N-acetyltransferase n=1 Tax=Sphingomonas sp. GM_Shp_2 TaxID=2937380 RepID=UPI00226A522C|nr:GNAT family N-acetyltransferase [Sphingomonas sp. GM_Shp_2]